MGLTHRTQFNTSSTRVVGRGSPVPVAPRNAPAPVAPKTAKPAKPKAASTDKPKRGRKSPDVYMGLQDPRHALLCAPAGYIDCREPIEEVTDDVLERPKTIVGLKFSGSMRGFNDKGARIWSVPSEAYGTLSDVAFPAQKATRRTEIEFEDANGLVITLTVFTGPWQWKSLSESSLTYMMGEFKYFGSKLTFNPECKLPEHAIGKIWTRYKGVPGQFSGDRVEELVFAALEDPSSSRACAAIAMGEVGLAEAAMLSAAADADGNEFQNFTELLRSLHKPETIEEGHAALECAKRLSAIAIQSAALRHHRRPAHPSAPIPMDMGDLNRLMGTLPMKLTNGQVKVATEIAQKLCEPNPLTGLLSGDVGTGKTLSFLLPAIAAHRAGARVSIIAPMQLLADQLAMEIESKFGSEILSVERIEAGGKIKNPQSILVGTAGLTSVAKKQGYVPNVLILDEQHKMSTAVKESLVGPGTHVIEGSATPIPRSLAASLYEGMTIFNLRECPVKKKINSHVMDMTDRGNVIKAIRATLAKGERAAMVYPRVSANSEDESNSVISAFESLSKVFPDDVVMLHGEMDVDELRENIKSLKSGARKLVVASTVLEIGIDIPSVSLMVVRDAERFGASQLHQLRGRLVRNGGEGDFMMVVADLSNTPDDAADRLQNVASTNDGYELAELDLIQRGFGQIDGDEQVGGSKTLFRLVALSAHDFMKKKLKTIKEAPPSTRSLVQESNRRDQYQQARLA